MFCQGSLSDAEIETCRVLADGLKQIVVVVQDVLPPHELNALLESEHRPNYVARVISEVIRAAEMQGTQIFIMDGNMTFFSDAVGKCERILSTPIPLSWTRESRPFRDKLIWGALELKTALPSWEGTKLGNVDMWVRSFGPVIRLHPVGRYLGPSESSNTGNGGGRN